MQSAFNPRKPKLFVKLVKINWQHETAYFTNTLLGMISPLFYTLTFILFISVLYQNVNSIAGYSRDEMLLVLFFGQINFYTYAFWGGSPALLEQYVNDGSFDYFLVRPISSMFLLSNHLLRPLSTIVNFLGPLLSVVLVINWSNLDLATRNIPFAFIIFVCGVYLYFTFQLIMSTVSFWTGRGQEATFLTFSASSQTIPLEGYGNGLKVLLLGAIPVMISAVAASVILGRSNAIFWTLTIVAVALLFHILKKIIWKRALSQYSSASS